MHLLCGDPFAVCGDYVFRGYVGYARYALMQSVRARFGQGLADALEVIPKHFGLRGGKGVRGAREGVAHSVPGVAGLEAAQYLAAFGQDYVGALAHDLRVKCEIAGVELRNGLKIEAHYALIGDLPAGHKLGPLEVLAHQHEEAGGRFHGLCVP